MSSDSEIARKSLLAAKMMIAADEIQSFIKQINKIENDPTMPMIEKIDEIKKIRVAMKKVGETIDSLQKEITILNSCTVN